MDSKDREWLSSHTKFNLGLTVDEIMQIRQQLETATALLHKVHEDAQQAPGGYLVSGSTIRAIGMWIKAREVTNG